MKWMKIYKWLQAERLDVKAMINDTIILGNNSNSLDENILDHSSTEAHLRYN